jgi:hypothetical protein
MTRTRRKPLVLLDTNVWGYIAAESAVNAVRTAALRRGVRIQIAPSALYEALRTSDPLMRERIVHVMTDPAWVRLMPDVRDEAVEFLHEVRRLRPQWIVARPQRTWVRQLQNDWTRPVGGFWDRARNTPELEASRLASLEGDIITRARRQAKKAREDTRAAGWTYERISLLKIRATPGWPLPGWDQDEVEEWRLSALVVTSSVIQSRDESHPFIDWLGNEVDLAKARTSPVDWNRLWLYEVDANRMPRHWLRWAFERLQSLKKVTDGTPCDAQLATYLTQCDWFITADQNFADMLRRVREEAPFDVALAKLVPGGPGGVESLLASLTLIGSR